ncbi:MAG: hypothetical protein IPF66_01635 [Holophagales bacterium]|nr:hypothetical protein [Holophagales bacterium]
MTVLLAARLALLLLAVGAARRARGPKGAAVVGLAGAAAAFGAWPHPLPQPVVLGAGLFVASLVLVFLGAERHSPLIAEAARATAALSLSAGAVAGLAFRGAGLAGALLGGTVVAAALSTWGAEGCRANTEVGWRRGLAWASAIVLPAVVAGGLLALGGALPPHLRSVGPAVGLLAGLLAWVVPVFLERRRVVRELSEEARLGILPDEDLAVLVSPWRRWREPRFGRADERREYVRSALLLAVARQQQRRRSGEASRLRQLEVLAFRTRVRRVVEGRAARFAALSALSDESSA